MTPQQLKTIRESMNMSKGQFAAFLGLRTERTIERYEKGVCPIPGPILKLLEAYQGKNEPTMLQRG